jgi:hypothetical protein
MAKGTLSENEKLRAEIERLKADNARLKTDAPRLNATGSQRLRRRDPVVIPTT